MNLFAVASVCFAGLISGWYIGSHCVEEVQKGKSHLYFAHLAIIVVGTYLLGRYELTLDVLLFCLLFLASFMWSPVALLLGGAALVWVADVQLLGSVLFIYAFIAGVQRYDWKIAKLAAAHLTIFFGLGISFLVYRFLIQ